MSTDLRTDGDRALLRGLILFISAATLIGGCMIFAAGNWHLGNPSASEAFGCSFAGGHEVSIGVAHHCAPVTR